MATNNIAISQGSRSTGSITVNKSTGGKLQSLSDVVTSDLQNGYSIVYNESINKWVAQPVAAAVGVIDGGVY